MEVGSVAVLSSVVGDPKSGQSRFTINLARGLKSLGAQTRVLALDTSPHASQTLRTCNIPVASLQVNTDSPLFKSRLVSPSNPVPRLFSRLLDTETPCDWYVVVSDDAIGTVQSLPPMRSIYISQGELNLLFLSPSFYRRVGLLKRALSCTAIANVRRNARFAERYRLRLANSEFTRQFMSLLYSQPFEGVVYPPVDDAVFRPTESSKPSRQLLYVGRNDTEPNLDLLRRVSSFARIRLVGGASLSGCESLGFVPDETLARLYSDSLLLLQPSTSEFYGYSIVEAMACGTPAVAFDCCGPAELIHSGRDGWKVTSQSQFVARVRDIVEGGYDPAVREEALRESRRFSIKKSAEDLLRYIVNSDRALC